MLNVKLRYGQLLKKLGHGTQAHCVLQDVVAHARRFKIKHAEEQVWVDIARRALSG